MVRLPRCWWVGLAVLVGGLVGSPAASAAITIHVKTTQDLSSGSGDPGDCVTTDQTCSLRQALAAAENGDTVSLPAGTYTLTQSSNSALLVPGNITISGAGARLTIIKQSEAASVLTISGAASATIQGVTITGGHATTESNGGGITNNGNLTLKNSAVIGNKADGSQFSMMMLTTYIPGEGGGIYEVGGSLTVIRSVISGNVAEPGNGSGAQGGGIWSVSPVKIINSTIAGNTAQGVGGVGFAPDGEGGGIFMGPDPHAALTLANATVAFNTASGTAQAQGGNLFLDGSGAPTTVKNSVIADGTADQGSENCFGASGQLASQGYNLEDHNDCAFTAAGDHVSVNARLGQLKNNGGPTNTVGLLSGSPAANGGNPSGCKDASGVALVIDQRGVARPQGTRCDIGAFEFRVLRLSGSTRISGAARVGRRLTCLVPAVQSPDGPATKSVSWLRNSVVTGSGTTYVVKSADEGHSLRCRLVAGNAAGSASATSAAVTVPVPPSVAITLIDINGRKATFSFRIQHATGARCALAKGSTRPHYSSCTSPRSYTKLAQGRYTFFVRAVGPGGTSAPAKHSFTIG